MKKIFTILLGASMMLAGTSAFAQASVGAGYVGSTVKTKVSSTTNKQNLNGFYVGGSYNFNIIKNLGVEPGLTYTFVNNEVNYASVADAKASEHYLSIPVMFNYAFPVNNDIVIRPFVGPSLSFGLASQVKYEVASSSTKVNLYDDDSDYGRFDVALGGGVAIDLFNVIRFKGGYDCGLLNRNTGDSNAKIHRNQYYFGVAYLF